MAAPPAAAGSIAASIRRSISTRPTSASRRTTSGTAGDSPGRTIFASSTTAARRVPTASRGASARSSSGGMKRSASGPVSTFPTSTRRSRPTIGPNPGAKGMDAIAGDKPFILHPDGVGWLFVTSGLKDGPLPTHYEPLETPVRQSALSRSKSYNPAADRKERPDNPYARSAAMSASPTCSRPIA